MMPGQDNLIGRGWDSCVLWRLVSEVFGKCNGSGLESPSSAGWENVKVTKPLGPSPSLRSLASSDSFHSVTFSQTQTAGVGRRRARATFSLNRPINVVVLKNVTTFNQDFWTIKDSKEKRDRVSDCELILSFQGSIIDSLSHECGAWRRELKMQYFPRQSSRTKREFFIVLKYPSCPS